MFTFTCAVIATINIYTVVLAHRSIFLAFIDICWQSKSMQYQNIWIPDGRTCMYSVLASSIKARADPGFSKRGACSGTWWQNVHAYRRADIARGRLYKHRLEVDVKRYAFTNSLRRFDETVIAAADHGRAAKIVVYARHSFSLGTHRRCDSGLHTIS